MTEFDKRLTALEANVKALLDRAAADDAEEAAAMVAMRKVQAVMVDVDEALALAGIDRT